MNNMSKNWKSILVYILIPILLIGAVIYFVNSQTSTQLKYSQVVSMFKNNEVSEFSLDLSSGNLVYKTFAKPKEEKNYSVPNVSYFLDDIRESVDKYNDEHSDKPIVYDYRAGTSNAWIYSMIPSLLMFVVLIALGIYAFRKMSGAMNSETNRTLGFGKIKTKTLVEDEKRKTTFKDVAGCDEEKSELEELVEFLKNPESFTELGARIPRGVLLVGPPGTGKTLLARAVAGEAGAPFLSISGSDFVEMYVGVGASRVRDLFEQAKKKAPAIVFIDEIDAVGRHRGAGTGGGNDEREQTLNQLLAEMDGFDTSKGLLILAATNRPEVLDKALLRPGRFDRRIIVDKPDLKGRLETLKVHSKDVKMDESVDLDALALATAGLVGSDLANMINEAAINAVKNGRQLVNQADLFEAFELVAVGGKEKKDRVMSDKERKIVSYHEVGHALVSALQKNTEPVQKITIVPRTMGALGYTLQTPEEEKYLETKDELLAKITTYMAGRAAEVLVFNSVTSGAANDIENATKIARAMVTMYGMSDKFGMMCLATVQNQYLEGGAGLICGENTASQIDDEVLSIINSSYAEAMKLLDENREILDSISDYLYQKETITGKEFMKMFRDMKGLPDPDEEKDGEGSKEQENAQNDETTAADPLLRNATDQPADTNESSGYTAPDDTSNN